MHEQKLYLDIDVKQYLKHFGEINKVVNGVIELAMLGTIDWQEVSEQKTPKQKGCKTKILINNDNYESYREEVGERSSLASVRKLLYYVYENELLDEYMKPQELYHPGFSLDFVLKIIRAQGALLDLRYNLKCKYMYEDDKKVDNFVKWLEELKDVAKRNS